MIELHFQVDTAKRVAPSLGLDTSKFRKGGTNYDPSKVVPSVYYSTQKRKEILGIKVKSMEETTEDTLVDFKNRGWVS